jgi:PBP1b-binding outer membrane lipoprotein LpoB
MTPMKFVAAVLAIAAFLAGCQSAWFWYQSSRGSPLGPMAEMHGPGTTTNPDSFEQMAAASAKLNERAAIWTAVTVFLGALSNLIGIAA